MPALEAGDALIAWSRLVEASISRSYAPILRWIHSGVEIVNLPRRSLLFEYWHPPGLVVTLEMQRSSEPRICTHLDTAIQGSLGVSESPASVTACSLSVFHG